MTPGLSLNRLCDPGEYALADSLALAKELSAHDAHMVEKLARELEGEPPPSAGRAERMLALFELLAPADQVLELLSSAKGSSSPRIRSKVNKLIARAEGNLEWAVGELQHSDPRVAANVVEAMWSKHEREGLREFFWLAAAHVNNRVAGNGLVGLFLLGDERAIPKLHEFGESWHSAFRSTAAWMIGRVNGEEFGELLQTLLRDENPKVRRNAGRSLKLCQLQTTGYSE